MTRIAFSLVASLAMCMLGGCKEGGKKSDSPGDLPAPTPETPDKSAGAPARGGATKGGATLGSMAILDVIQRSS